MCGLVTVKTPHFAPDFLKCLFFVCLFWIRNRICPTGQLPWEDLRRAPLPPRPLVTPGPRNKMFFLMSPCDMRITQFSGALILNAAVHRMCAWHMPAYAEDGEEQYCFKSFALRSCQCGLRVVDREWALVMNHQISLPLTI